MTDTHSTLRRWAIRMACPMMAAAIMLVTLTPCGAAEPAEKTKSSSPTGSMARQLAALAKRFSTFSDNLPPVADMEMKTLLAFEEHAQFVYVRGMGLKRAGDARIVFCKPATFVVFVVTPGGEKGPADARELVPTGTSEATFTLVDGETKVTGQMFAMVGDSPDKPKRFACTFHLGDKAKAPKVTATEANGTLNVELTTGGRTFTLALPNDPNVPGTIAVAQGKKPLLAKRPLPASIMPHGAKGVAMMERWDSSYRRTRMPGWDVGRPASELKAIIENGTIKKGKALVLGCGTGTNAVYLASKGFEVTGVDVAPTALVLAEKLATKNKVKVRWLVADVVLLPDIGEFDFIFDRGCYHHVQKYDAAGFVKSMDSRTKGGAHFLLLAGNANEPRHGGPPRVEETQLVDNFAKTWDFVSLKEIRFESQDPTRKNGPWAWSALMRRRAAKE